MHPPTPVEYPATAPEVEASFTLTPPRRSRRAALARISSLSFPFLAGCTLKKESPESYPTRLIELIVPWAAGGGTDRVARFIADQLQSRLGQPVVVVNRTGGSGAVGHSAGALAPPDGYTITMATFELSTMHSMGISKLTWNNFAPVAQLNGDAAALFVRKDAPWLTLPDLLTHIRESSGKLKMSGTSTGGAWDLARSGLLLAAGIPPSDVIWAPTQGSAPALVELLGGHVDVVCCSVPEAAAQLASGHIRPLAVLGPRRLPEYPDYPTALEQGIDYEAVGWRGLMLPRDTPQLIIDKLARTVHEIGQSDPFKEFMRKNGFAIELKGPADFAQFLQEQDAKWGAVINSAGYQTLGKNHDPGPLLLPKILGALLLLALVLELARSKRRRTSTHEPATPPPDSSWKNPAFLLLALICYLLLMPLIGFHISTFFFAGALTWKLGAKPWIAALSSLTLVAAIHLLFVTLFKVQLP
jgi:tripartite-type tricarboxylate transporter receptor subunit TctC